MSGPTSPPGLRHLPLAALRAFEATARQGSMTAAAAELNVTHGAVSRQIASLERLLGTAVFERGARGVNLTNAGRQLFRDVGGGFEKLRHGLSEVRTTARIVWLTTLPSLATRWLLPQLVAFQNEQPGIEVRIHSSLDIADLTGGHFELGIRYGRGNWPGVKAEILLRGETFPVCSRDLLARIGPFAGPADLLHAPLIHNAATERWADWFEANGVTAPELPRGPVVEDYALALEYAVGGFGIALGREVLVRDDIERGRLVRPVAGALASDFGYYLVRSIARPVSPDAELFASWLIRSAARTSAS